MKHRNLVMGLASAAVLLGVVNGAQAQVVSHLNVVSDKSEDVSSPEAWKKTYIKDGMSDQDKAIAVFNTLVRYRQQASPPQEDLQLGCAHDPFKTIHVYGYGQCCCASGEVSGLLRYLGYQARGRIIAAHSVPEMFYNDTWHLIDCSVMNYHINDKGELASVDEIHNAVMDWSAQHPDLANNDAKLRAFAQNGGWKNGPALMARGPRAEEFFGKDGTNTAGWHGWHSNMQEYYWKPGKADLGAIYEYAVSMGYQLNVQLRPGEKITRNFFSRGIRYTNNMDQGDHNSLQDRKLLGIQTKLGDRAPGRVGDGTFEWNVPLKLDTLKTVALTADNLGVAPAGVTLADAAKPAILVLRFPSSYVYVMGEAVIAANVAQGGSIAVSFSDNNGLDWKPLAKIDKSGEQKLALTNLIKRRYDYQLKFELAGAGTSLTSLKTTNDFQCSQAALPTITEGKNTINFSAGPQEGTVTLEGSTNPAEAKGKQIAMMDYHPKLNGLNPHLLGVGESGTGEGIFTVKAPGDITRVRVNSTFRARDAKDQYTVQVSFDGGKSFTEAGKMVGPTGSGSSKYMVVDNVPAGTKEAQVKLIGQQRNTTCLFSLRIDADYKEPAGAFKPVKITYAWDENGQTKTNTYVAQAPQATYTIDCGPKAKVKSYAMELAE